MKVKFRFGIKSYSGTLDELVYANYEDRAIVIGRMLPTYEELTPQNISIKTKSAILANFYGYVSEGFKTDLANYTKKMFNLPEFKNKLRGNAYATFVKLMWGATKDGTNPLDIESLSTDDLGMGVYSQLENIKTVVENGYLPKVKGYEDYTNSIHA